MSEWERVLDSRLKPVHDSINEIKQSNIEMAKALTTLAVQAETLRHHRGLIEYNAEINLKAHDEFYSRLRVTEQDIAKNKDCKLSDRVDAIEKEIQTKTWDTLKGIVYAVVAAILGAWFGTYSVRGKYNGP